MTSKKMNLRPLSDRLVVEPKEQEEQTASGIILPETAKEKPQQGTVLAFGPGRMDEAGKRIAMSTLLWRNTAIKSTSSIVGDAMNQRSRNVPSQAKRVSPLDVGWWSERSAGWLTAQYQDPLVQKIRKLDGLPHDWR